MRCPALTVPPPTHGAESVLALGRVWALLAALRLHLLLPPAGADPAAKHGLVRAHALSTLRCQVEPELAVRRQYAALPGETLPCCRHGCVMYGVCYFCQLYIMVEKYAVVVVVRAGGPDQAARIAELEARCGNLVQQAERLQRRSTPRPTPPQYLTVSTPAATRSACESSSRVLGF